MSTSPWHHSRGQCEHCGARATERGELLQPVDFWAVAADGERTLTYEYVCQTCYLTRASWGVELAPLDDED